MSKVGKRIPTNAFKKGNKVSKGQVSYDAQEILLRSMTPSILSRLYNIYIWKSENQLRELLKNKDLSIFESVVCQSLVDARRNGSIHTIEYFVSRLIGKMPETINHGKTDPYQGFTTEQLLAEHRRLSEINKKTLDHILEKDEKLKALEIEYRDVSAKPK